jgi:hypothetical protein
VFPVRLSINSAAFTFLILLPDHSSTKNLVRDLHLYGEKSSPEHRGEHGWGRCCEESEFFEGGPGEEEVFGALGREVDHGLGLVTRTRDVDDDAFAEGAVLDPIAHP